MGISYRTNYCSRYDCLLKLSAIMVKWFLGSFRIYRVPNSVTFLDSGRTLHAILPKSQCWCVDGEAKFVLRIRPDTYYRIELPNTCDEDKETANALKSVLAKVSQYELTACPFKREFTVTLPDPPKTPLQKRPWQPKGQPTLASPHIKQASCSSMSPSSFSKRMESQERADDDRSTEASDSSSTELESTNDIIAGETVKLARPNALVGGRSVTAPPNLTPRTDAPLQTMEPLEERIIDDEATSIASSVDSFHSFPSFHSPITPLPPSPPYSNPPSPQSLDHGLGINNPRTRSHRRDVSDITVTASSVNIDDNMDTPRGLAVDTSSAPIRPGSPALTESTSQYDDAWSGIRPSTPSDSVQRRTLQREHSPLPSPTNIYSPKTRLSGHHLTTAILQKTCSLLLGPPVQLVALMLNIAAKIANGAFGGFPAHGEGSQSIPCSWDYSDGEDETGDGEMWEEDDYGITTGIVPASKTRRRRDLGGSWEID